MHGGLHRVYPGGLRVGHRVDFQKYLKYNQVLFFPKKIPQYFVLEVLWSSMTVKGTSTKKEGEKSLLRLTLGFGTFRKKKK